MSAERKSWDAGKSLGKRSQELFILANNPHEDGSREWYEWRREFYLSQSYYAADKTLYWSGWGVLLALTAITFVVLRALGVLS